MSVDVKLTEFAEYRDEIENCRNHPEADKMRVWEEKRYVLNGVESHVLSRKITGYECAKCGNALLRKP